MGREIKDAKIMAGWYESYMTDDQGKALIKCLSAKAKQQETLLNNIKGELELAMNPKEEDYVTVINSIEAMIDSEPKVKAEVGYFIWEYPPKAS